MITRTKDESNGSQLRNILEGKLGFYFAIYPFVALPVYVLNES